MAECFNCGAYIRRGAGYRREVYTGHSNRVYFFRRGPGFSTGRSYGIRTLCGSCAIGQVVGKLIGVGLVIGGLIWLFSGSSPSPAPVTHVHHARTHVRSL